MNSLKTIKFEFQFSCYLKTGSKDQCKKNVSARIISCESIVPAERNVVRNQYYKTCMFKRRMISLFEQRWQGPP